MPSKNEAITIFEEKHPNKIGVFVFNQSSAYASKGSRALNAFTINLGKGGALFPQKDTYFPPNISKSKRARGLVSTIQKLNYKVEKVIKVEIPNKKKRVKKTIIKKVSKGIKQILIEKRCLLTIKNCQSLSALVWKATFDDARQAAFKALDSYPLNTLRRA
ncbi:hypothetical protein DL98DRAFT_542103 [Cadophora sp. DSE1049]|nr:hypothetical protein DL98DRAFT_542103 [Cadophora sp. DSE1049]